MGANNKGGNRLMGWLALLFLCAVLFSLFLAVKAQSAIGVAATLAIFTAIFWFFARRGRKYYEAHPQEAAEATRKRAVMAQDIERRTNRDFKAKMVGVGIALGIVIVASAGRKFMPVFAALSRQAQLTWLLLGGVVAIVAINVVIGIVKKRRALSARP
jgi:Ca2+/Na+ antiporter